MNVLMVGLDDSVFPDSRKPGNTFHRLARYLDAVKEVDPDSSLTDLVFTRRRVQPYTPRPDLRFIPVKAPHLLLFPLAGLATISKWRLSLHPDLISAQNPFESGLLGLALGRIFNSPLEIQVHLNLFSPYWLIEHRLLNRLRLFLARYVLEHADTVRVVSKPIQRSMIQNWKIQPERISVIPIPVIYDKPPKLNQNQQFTIPEDNIVLFAGRFSHSKNLPGFFILCEKLLETHQQVKFILIGDGPERGYAERQVDRIGSEHFHLLGNVPYEELPLWYQRADVLVLPSLHEGFARVLVESYLFELPGVATRCGGPEDIILDGETGFLTDIGDLEAFAEKVKWLLEHPEEAKSMGRRGRTFIEHQFKPEALIASVIQNWVDTASMGRRNL